MTNVLILHGKPDKEEFYDPEMPMVADDHWYPWLQKQILIRDIDAVRPQVARAFEATYEDWAREVNRFEIDESTILVGHSTGAGFFLRWLSENRNIRVKKLVLVAPFLDPFGFMRENFGFDLFDFERDPNVLNRIGDCKVFHSDNDQESIQLTVDEIKQVWTAMPIRIFHNYGHFCKQDLENSEFPELLHEILSAI